MTNEKILKKAIEIAEKNGFDFKNQIYYHLGLDAAVKDISYPNHYYVVVFDHNFAKAFWGEKDYWKETKCTCGGVDFHIAGPDAHQEGCAKIKARRGYKFHLQQMVLEKEPIKYIERFLK